MKLNLFYGRTYFESFEKIINDLKKNYSKEENYLFIVPDRFTLFTEKYVMDKLNLRVAFNIDILTLNTLANRNCLINDYVDNETATMILSKVIFNIKDKLKVLKSTQNSFSEEMYALIQQIKSSRVKSEEFSNCEFTGSDYEKLKKQDIALIYSEYEKYLEETGVDSVKKFEIFIDEIKNIQSVKQSYVYIAGFESFTSQGYAIIENLIKYSKGVKISTLNYIDQNNKFLYPCDCSYQIRKICKDLKIECLIDDKKIILENNFIINNLWAVSGERGQDQIRVFEANSQIEQYRRVAETIWENIISKKLKFSDFNLVLNAGDENERMLLSVLNDYKISYFYDASQNLSNFVVIKFICQVNECVIKNFDRLSFVEYSKSPFVEGSVEEKNKFENFANSYSIRYGEFYKKKESLERANGYLEFFEYSSKIAKNILEYKKLFTISNDYISNYIKATHSLIEIFDLKNKFEQILEGYKDENKEVQYKFGKKVFERLDILLNNLDRVLGNTKVSFKEFVSIFQSGLFATKISIVPQSVDAVFVGDIKNSFFLPRKYNLFLDCENNTMPCILSDNGIFSDEDIDNSKTKFKIDPQIKLLNKKIRLKTLSLLCLGKLSLFYSIEGGKEPSKIIKDLEKVCVVNYTKCESKNDYYFALGKNSLLEYLTKYYAHDCEFVEKVKECLDGQLKIELEKLTLPQKKSDLLGEEYKDIFIKKDSFSVSQIENFYSCPFKHFIDYGLNLKQKDDGDLSSLQVGNIIHEFCQISFKNLGKQKDFELLSDDIFESIINKDKYISIKNNPRNKNLLKSLKSECKRIYEAIDYQTKYSQLSNHFTEKKFICDFEDIYQKYFDEQVSKIKFEGKIDRIDYDNESFIIIDYKTGNTEMNYKDIYYGKKLQILAYALAMEEITGKKCIGIFYMPIKNTFHKKDENRFDKYKLSGIYLRDELKAIKIDKRLAGIFDNNLSFDCEYDVIKERKSDIINLTMEKNFNTIKISNSNLSDNEFKLLKEYILKMINNALNEIYKGNINVLPYIDGRKSSCDYCGYKGICKVDKFSKFRYYQGITKNDILGEYNSSEVLENFDEE